MTFFISGFDSKNVNFDLKTVLFEVKSLSTKSTPRTSPTKSLVGFKFNTEHQRALNTLTCWTELT